MAPLQLGVNLIKPAVFALALLATGCTTVHLVPYTTGQYLTLRHVETGALIAQWDMVLEFPCGQLVEEIAKRRINEVRMMTCSNEPVGRYLPVVAVAKFEGLPRASDLDFSSMALCERLLRLPNLGMTVVEGCRQK